MDEFDRIVNSSYTILEVEVIAALEATMYHHTWERESRLARFQDRPFDQEDMWEYPAPPEFS